MDFGMDVGEPTDLMTRSLVDQVFMRCCLDTCFLQTDLHWSQEVHYFRSPGQFALMLKRHILTLDNLWRRFCSFLAKQVTSSQRKGLIACVHPVLFP